MNRLNDDFLAYLRSVLMQNNYEGDHKDFIMVSAPRLIEFELMVLDYAIKIIQEVKFKNQTPFKTDSTASLGMNQTI